jgi:hypothetical protein
MSKAEDVARRLMREAEEAGERFPDEGGAIRQRIAAALEAHAAEAVRAAQACPIPGPAPESELALAEQLIGGLPEGEWMADTLTRGLYLDNTPIAWFITDLHTEEGQRLMTFLTGAAPSMRALRAHVAHLEGLLRDAAADGLLASYQRGLKAGRLEGLREAVAVVRDSAPDAERFPGQGRSTRPGTCSMRC